MDEVWELLAGSDLGWQLALAGAVLLTLFILQALFFAVMRSCGEDGFDASLLAPSFCKALLFPISAGDRDGDFAGDGDSD